MAKNQDKGEALRRRVLALFSRTLPFRIKTYPEQGKSNEKIYYLTPDKILFSKIDVSLEDEDEVFVVIECKHVSKKPTLQDIADRLKRIKRDQKAKAGLIVISGVKIQQAVIKEIYKKYHLFVWDDDLLSYYEKVSSTLGKFSFFEIMHSLEIELENNPGDDFRPALSFEQVIGEEKVQLVSFTAYPQDMIKRVYVFRHANKKANSYQRLLNKNKLGKISEYLRGGGNIINSILVLLPNECKFNKVALKEKEQRDWYYGKNVKGVIGKITLPRKYCFIEIIDGQHRLYSFTKFDDSNVRKEFPLHFIGIIGGNKEVARDLFITINQKARKIDANLLASIQEEWDRRHLVEDSEALARQVVRELNRNSNSALRYKILEGERVTKEHSNLKLYIAMLAYHGIKPLVKQGGVFSRFLTRSDSRGIFSHLNNYINRMKKIFPEEYQNTNIYVVFTNNGLIPLLKIYGDICNYHGKIPNDGEIDEVLKLIRDYSWELSTVRGRSSGAGWKVTYDELIARIKRDEKLSTFPIKPISQSNKVKEVA
ncbi:MAG TPA: DGQHR domain-containing protein [Candidatus Nanoarchaeia archaeon]|nr:DGQHR domain-containing protein [Candidatus Nanoarchaeia archaeon]